MPHNAHIVINEAKVSEAAKEIKINSVSIEGLEEVFDVEPVPVTDAAPVTSAAERVTEVPALVATNADGIPVEQAASILGTSVNALKKRLRKGTLQGKKLEIKHGEKWFVDLSEIEKHKASLEPVPITDSAPVTGSTEPVLGDPPPAPSSAEQVELVALLEDLERKLEGASFRNGYLEAENEGLRALLGAKDSQIKLLTDRQHKSSGWSRFWSWFTGRY